MPSIRLTKINIDKDTYNFVKELAKTQNVSATKMLELIVNDWWHREKDNQ